MRVSPNFILLFITLGSALPASGAGQSSGASSQVSSEDNASHTGQRHPGSAETPPIDSSDGSMIEGSPHASTDHLVIPGEQSEHPSVPASESQDDTLCDCQLAKPKKKGLTSSTSILTITLKGEDNSFKLKDLQTALNNEWKNDKKVKKFKVKGPKVLEAEVVSVHEEPTRQMLKGISASLNNYGRITFLDHDGARHFKEVECKMPRESTSPPGMTQ